MHRRAVLGGVGCLLATPGCLSRLLIGGPIADRELTAYDPGTDFYDAAPGLREPPSVTFEREATAVEITGTLFVGSSTCHEAALAAVSYDGSTETLHVTVGSGESEQAGNACTGDESADAYRAVVTFEEQFPSTVVATEIDSPGESETTARNPYGG